DQGACREDGGQGGESGEGWVHVGVSQWSGQTTTLGTPARRVCPSPVLLSRQPLAAGAVGRVLLQYDIGFLYQCGVAGRLAAEIRCRLLRRAGVDDVALLAHRLRHLGRGEGGGDRVVRAPDLGRGQLRRADEGEPALD